MKTHRPRIASFQLLGSILFLSLLSSTLLQLDLNGLIDLAQNCKSQWLNFTDWVNSGMMRPHQGI